MNFTTNTLCILADQLGLPYGDWQFYVVTLALLIAFWLIIKPFTGIAVSGNRKNCNDQACSGPRDKAGCPFCNGVSIRRTSKIPDDARAATKIKLTRITIDYK